MPASRARDSVARPRGDVALALRRVQWSQLTVIPTQRTGTFVRLTGLMVLGLAWTIHANATSSIASPFATRYPSSATRTAAGCSSIL